MTDDTADVDVDLERAYDREELADVFREFAAALAEDRPLRIDDGERAVAVSVPPRVAAALEAERDPEAEPPVAELELELEWDDPEGRTLQPIERDRDGETAGAGTVASDDTTDRESTADPATAVMPPEAGVGRAESDDSEDEGAASGTAPDERTSRFEVYEDRASEWRWRLVHWNGNIVADGGEGYASRSNAKRAVRSVIRTASTATIEDRED